MCWVTVCPDKFTQAEMYINNCLIIDYASVGIQLEESRVELITPFTPSIFKNFFWIINMPNSHTLRL